MKSHTITFLSDDPFFNPEDIKRALNAYGLNVASFHSADGASPVIFSLSEKASNSPVLKEEDSTIPPSCW